MRRLRLPTTSDDITQREYSRKSVYESGENQSTVYSTHLRRTFLRDIATKCGDTTVSRGHRVICVATKASRRRCCGISRTTLLAPALCSLPLYTIFCDPFGGNLSVVWSPRGRPWCSGWEAHKKILRTATPQ